MSKNQVQWRRTREDGGLDLFVKENDKWKHYSASKLYLVDSIIQGKYGNSSDGFRTLQACLKAGYEYLKVEDDK